MSVLSYLQDRAHWSGPGAITDLALQHLAWTGVAVLAAAAVGVPLGLLVGHTGRGALLVTGLRRATRALPSLALLFLGVLLLGAGAGDVVVVLALLAVPTVLTAVAAGTAGADREAVRAGRALGMTEGQVLIRVEWPLALPGVVAGLRSATLQVVATATVAALATDGGLGLLITRGQAQGDQPQMVAGALLVAALAVLLGLVWSGLGWLAARRARVRADPVQDLVVVPA